MRRLDSPEYQFARREEAHLRALFERVLEPRAATQDAQSILHEEICAFVRGARAEGRQVETIIIALKDIFRIPDRPSRSLHGDEDAPPRVQLARRVISWCIREYYGPDREVPM